ncbi:hypothetical protein [uncultured Devosia sp.]|uniref:hypothetical protein n=1 Tax=uncultured Devosia sp. TaxID=211434 RepID=UPI0026299AD1|nr:hypothetical protein [uncultured Devosia sp.]
MFMQPTTQPANGGFFGSMLSGNGGMGGNIGAQAPTSMTSPPIDPKILALLTQLQNQSAGTGAGTPGASSLPPNSMSPFMPQAPQQQPAQQQPTNGLADLLKNPQVMAMLQKIGVGGTPPVGAP